MWFLRLNMTDQTFKLEEVPTTYKDLGGRGLSSSIISAEVPPLAHPLGPFNKLAFCPGIVTGTAAPTSSRISAGAKSPLTGGIKESNAGTSWSRDLASMKIKALIVEGQPKEKDRFSGVYLVVNNAGAPGVQFADKALFDQGRKKVVDALMTHDITKPKGALNTYGTAVLINILNEAGGLPTRNFSSGRFEGAAKIAGEAIFEGNKQRLGKELYNHACSPGCIIQCSNTWHKPDGTEHASCVEYESDWSLGANCGIDNLDDIAELICLCNGYGLDTIETGTTIAVAMEAGVVPFGDSKGAIKLLHEMGDGTPMGRILGGGTEFTGRAFGLTRVPTVKGQSMPAYEPRAVKGIGVTYATSTMGADHTAGYTIATEILSVGGKADPLNPEGKAALSRGFQAATAFIDSSGHCLFIAFAVLDIPSGLAGMVEECNGVLGTKWTTDDIGRIGTEILKKERMFNEAAGFTKAHDRLPEFMAYEKLPPHNVVFDVPDKVLDSVYGEL